MTIIEVTDLRKTFRSKQKEPGLAGSLRSRLLNSDAWLDGIAPSLCPADILCWSIFALLSGVRAVSPADDNCRQPIRTAAKLHLPITDKRQPYSPCHYFI